MDHGPFLDFYMDIYPAYMHLFIRFLQFMRHLLHQSVAFECRGRDLYSIQDITLTMGCKLLPMPRSNNVMNQDLQVCKVSIIHS